MPLPPASVNPAKDQPRPLVSLHHEGVLLFWLKSLRASGELCHTRIMGVELKEQGMAGRTMVCACVTFYSVATIILVF